MRMAGRLFRVVCSCILITSCSPETLFKFKEKKGKTIFSRNVDLEEMKRREVSGYSDLEIRQMIVNQTALLLNYTMKKGLIHQVEYYAPDGSAYLWYPNNTIPVQGRWEIKQNKRICFTYSKHSYNPHTNTMGDVPLCKSVASWDADVIDRHSGDLFNLLSMRLPRVLQYGYLYKDLQELKNNTGTFVGKRKGLP